MAIRNHIDQYLSELSSALSVLDRDAIVRVIDELMRAAREGRQVLTFGNGGSASLASHMACDLAKTARVSEGTWLRATSLVDHTALLTALANDVSYDNVFSDQVRDICQRGDVVVAISCSGNSPNVLAATRMAKRLGATTLGLTGTPGGRLAEMVDVCVKAPIGAIWQQEDVHLAISHMITSALRLGASLPASGSQRPRRAMVLAAGDGTRLLPLTEHVPKPMLPIDGKPLLRHTLEWLHRYGVTEVAINLHRHAKVITEDLGDGADLGLHLTYSHEPSLLGTAGALRKLRSFFESGPVVVVYGDVLTDLDLTALLGFHEKNTGAEAAPAATLALYHVPNPCEVGIVDMDERGRLTRFVEKPAPSEAFSDLASAGVLVTQPSLLDAIPKDTFADLGLDVFPRLIAAGQPLYGWVVPPTSYILDIGTMERYARAQVEWPAHERRSRHASPSLVPRS